MRHFVVGCADLAGAVFGEEHLVVPDDLSTMAVQAGVFPSRSQARRAGLAGPAPQGLTLIGTRRRQFWVWKETPAGEARMGACFDRTEKWFNNQEV